MFNQNYKKTEEDNNASLSTNTNNKVNNNSAGFSFDKDRSEEFQKGISPLNKNK